MDAKSNCSVNKTYIIVISSSLQLTAKAKVKCASLLLRILEIAFLKAAAQETDISTLMKVVSVHELPLI